MTAGSDEPEDERTHATGEDSPERRNRQNGEHPADGRHQRTGDRGRETAGEPEGTRADVGSADRDGAREETSGSEAAAETDAPDAGREEWRFALEEVGTTDEEDEEGNVAGILMRDEPLEPGTIDPENAAFFLLGALGTILFVVLAVTGL